ncbi:hypothetical protein HDEF_1234 [Candidatus Hamiltonella defensa 5AT (Acyrthosiphon pisum)]|uniref:Uncharacterized protein n=1 Tax=Hamiltonella defensa subsp. Acyrthosiphon pisum (strain 5AT) TaxID=572265 RepID=C4K5P9_HAMD5|nr:hypothetical protein HDEF_1234 [Candidatus Hamiltonella defensa 5AT (Acyrthosiphon pisum)]
MGCKGLFTISPKIITNICRDKSPLRLAASDQF